jgi:putative transposon-encoded protein
MMTNQELSELLAVLGIKDDIVNVTKRDVNVAFRKRVSSWGKSMKLMRPKVVNLVKMYLVKMYQKCKPGSHEVPENLCQNRA